MQQYFHTVHRLRDAEAQVRDLHSNSIVVAVDFYFVGSVAFRAMGEERCPLSALFCMLTMSHHTRARLSTRAYQLTYIVPPPPHTHTLALTHTYIHTCTHTTTTTTIYTTVRACTGELEKLAVALLAIPTILISFLFWTALVIVGLTAAGMVAIAAGGSVFGFCFWTVRGEPFAMHDLTVECPGIM
jgi:hypothetical protein